MALLQMSLNIAAEGLAIFSSWWLSHWAEWQQTKNSQTADGILYNDTIHDLIRHFHPFPFTNEAYHESLQVGNLYWNVSLSNTKHHDSSSGHSPWHFIAIYALVSLTICILMFCQSVVTRISGVESSKNLFRGLLSTVLHASMSFHDTTPLGRVTNRFSRDVNILDDTLPDKLLGYFFSGTNLVCFVLYVCWIMPYITIALLPLASFYRTTER